MTNTDTATQAPTPKTRREPEQQELLSPYGHLPEVYVHFMPDNTQQQIVGPCYRLLAECYLDETLWQEGEVIVTEVCPNYHMQPLNRAAGERIERWLQSMPVQGVQINIDDQVEAAGMLRNHPDIAKMSHEEASAAYLKLALGLKAKRDRTYGMALPPMAGQTWGTSRSQAPAMPNARFTDPSRRGPGHVGEHAVIHQPQRGPDKVARASARPAMTGAPLPTR